MNRRIWKCGPVVIAGGLLLTSLVAAPVGAAPPPPAELHPAATTGADQQRVAEYWTPERMRAAVPMDQLATARPATPARVPAGEPATVAPSTPQATDAGPLSVPQSGGAWSGGGAVTRTGGRVFFTFNGQNASCSGDAVTSTNGSVVMTAGHCVKYQGSWHTNWVFVPGYNKGSKPYGAWAARATLSTPQWTASEDINYDVGAAVVGQLEGRRLTDVVGGQGIAFNQARGRTMYSFGYPAAAPYDGTKLIYCSGVVIDDFLLSNDLGLNCNMTGGASGGPWFLNFNEASGTGLQNSVNSFKYNFFPWMFGPYFGADAQNLYNQAQAA
jgi:V8-like Glu-specific endopeptidase